MENIMITRTERTYFLDNKETYINGKLLQELGNKYLSDMTDVQIGDFLDEVIFRLEDLDLDWKVTNDIISSAVYKIIFDKSCDDILPLFLEQFGMQGVSKLDDYTLQVLGTLDMASIIFVNEVKYYTNHVGNNFYISAFPFPIE